MAPRPSASLAPLAALALAAGAAFAHPAHAQAPTPAALSAAARTITPADMYARIEFLASDAMRGRNTPSPELDIAASYLVNQYKLLGLRPGGEGGTFYQRYPYPRRMIDTASAHLGTVDGAGQNVMLAYGSDFYATAVAARPGEGVDMNHASLVYVGTLGPAGLPAGSYRETVPMALIPGAVANRDWRMAVTRARTRAQEAGATAVAVVLDPAFPDSVFSRLAAASRVAARALPDDKEIAVFYLTHAAASAVARRANVDLAAQRATVAAAVPLTGLQAHFAARAALLDRATAPNVIAILPGSDPVLRNEYVVVSAHMDHVGVGRPVNGDSIYNGADDDASGTAGILEVAQAMASMPVRPRRSVVFLHVSGEEKGLIGSRWFSDHPTLPLGQIVADINVDMIGRNAADSIVVIGKTYSSMGAQVNAIRAAHPELHLVAADDVWPQERFFFRSDHYNFARKEVPAIFFFSGTHPDYHQPSDEVEKIDTDKASRVARLVFYLAAGVANDRARPQWDPRGLEEVRSLTR
ncbi:MAG TPA: M20/M25/M40 family metallo-hydrolase [Longimicrobiaceae bacterium]|nr:M20/M25/M40 family metallo-hydrolase [Longimicrobiaceae bacterium]